MLIRQEQQEANLAVEHSYQKALLPLKSRMSNITKMSLELTRMRSTSIWDRGRSKALKSGRVPCIRYEVVEESGPIIPMEGRFRRERTY